MSQILSKIPMIQYCSQYSFQSNCGLYDYNSKPSINWAISPWEFSQLLSMIKTLNQSDCLSNSNMDHLPSSQKIVRQKSHKFNPAPSQFKNLMHNKRVFRGHIHNLHNIRQPITPQEQQQHNLQTEKENRQNEMIKLQIDHFKSNRLKKTPYDIRPGPTAKIPIDLKYFLTDRRRSLPGQANNLSQTDDFLPPIARKFIPKKTGMDASTQIWDGDLFNFDEESGPITQILAFKTIEESLQEVEQEAEFACLEQKRVRFESLRQQILESDLKDLEQERLLLERRNNATQKASEFHAKQGYLARKLMNLNIASTYLSKLAPNTIHILQQENVYPDEKTHRFQLDYYETLLTRAQTQQQTRIESLQLLSSVQRTVLADFSARRQVRSAKNLKKIQKEETRMINQSTQSRLMSLVYQNAHFNPCSELRLRLPYILNNREYPSSLADEALLCDAESDRSGPASPRESPELARALMVEQLEILSFSVYNHPSFETPRNKRKFTIHWEVYSVTGELLYSQNIRRSCPGIKFHTNCKDTQAKVSDDERLIISLKKLPSLAHHILLYIQSDDIKAQGLSKYHLDHHPTAQILDINSISEEDFQYEGQCYLAYRIYMQDRNPRNLAINDDMEAEFGSTDNSWLLDFYNKPLDMSIQEACKAIQTEIMAGWQYQTRFTSQLIEYRMHKKEERFKYLKRWGEYEESLNTKKRLKPPPEPLPMTEYSIDTMENPSRTYGPYRFERQEEVNIVQERLREFVDFLMDPVIFVKGEELSRVSGLFKVKCIFDLQIGERPPKPSSESEENNSEY